jgi:hypothetical protein
VAHRRVRPRRRHSSRAARHLPSHPHEVDFQIWSTRCVARTGVGARRHTGQAPSWTPRLPSSNGSVPQATFPQLRDANQRKTNSWPCSRTSCATRWPTAAAADLLRLGAHDEARVRKASEIVGRQVQHLTGLVDDLIDVSRVTRRHVELDCIPLECEKHHPGRDRASASVD